LTNPAKATHQVIGVFADHLRPILANTLAQLGSQAAWIVHGHDGLDEVSPYGPTRVSELRNGKIQELEIAPEDFGIPCSAPGAARGGDAQENAAIIEQVLSGQKHPATDAFVLNAAAALVVAEALEPKKAAQRAREIIETKAALAVLDRWRTVCRDLKAQAAAS
jgi:anthranilate phosphoribosyltransferase